MRRRTFIASMGCVAAGWPLTARAQSTKHIPKIGLMFTGTAETTRQFGFADDLRAGLKEQGLIDGENVVLEIRYGERHPERLPALAAELVALPVDVIVAAAEAFNAARRATSTIPIVSASTSDAVASGAGQSLAHPGGNITGISVFFAEYLMKRLELLSRSVPGLRRVGLLLTHKDIRLAEDVTEEARHSLGLDLRTFVLDDDAEFEPPIAEIAARAEAMAVFDDGRLTVERAKISALALKYRLPAVSSAIFVASGMLLGYGSDVHWQYRRAAVFVAKILDGAKPGDIPFERPPRFVTGVNLKTARALGLEIPPSVLASADEVIE